VAQLRADAEEKFPLPLAGEGGERSEPGEGGQRDTPEGWFPQAIPPHPPFGHLPPAAGDKGLNSFGGRHRSTRPAMQIASYPPQTISESLLLKERRVRTVPGLRKGLAGFASASVAAHLLPPASTGQVSRAAGTRGLSQASISPARTRMPHPHDRNRLRHERASASAYLGCAITSADPLLRRPLPGICGRAKKTSGDERLETPIQWQALPLTGSG